MTDTNRILQQLGFSSLAPMQAEMLDVALRFEGIVLLSPTGSGKTLAYMLPLARLLDCNSDNLQAIVIVPTRELAQQSADMLKSMKTGLRGISLYGGRPAMKEHGILRDIRPHVVFATPGRLNDHLQKGNISPNRVTLLVMDEFDKCLELGFRQEIKNIISHFNGKMRCWLTSATDSDEIPQFMDSVTGRFQKLVFTQDYKSTEERVEVWQVPAPNKDKLDTLGRLLCVIEGKPAIVFVAHRESVERVGKWLLSKGFDVTMYHGGMEQDLRERAVYKFRSGVANVLVSTDLAARGLDIPEVQAVIHYHLPGKDEEYVHRNGRTARWESYGKVYLLVGPEESLPDYIQAAKPLNVEEVNISPRLSNFRSLYIGWGKRDKLSKADILGFLCKKGGLTAAEIGKINVAEHHSYVAVQRMKIKSLLRLIAGEKIKGMKTLIEETKR